MSQVSEIFYNGHILTMDAFNSAASALAVGGDRILAVGGTAELLALADARTRLTDLDGATVIPGFVDAHGHFFRYAEMAATAVCVSPPPVGGCRAVADCARLLRQRAQTTPVGDWVLGYGFDDTLIAEHRYLTRHDLDAVSTEHPVFVHHFSLHMAMLNSRALERLGLDARTPDPEGGRIRREENGTPDGVLEETAAMRAAACLPRLDRPRLMDAMEAAGAEFAAKGITSALEAGCLDVEYANAVRALAREGRLPVRVTYNPFWTCFDEPESVIFETPTIRRNGVKIVQDGSLPGGTAFLSRPYHTPVKGDPAWRGYPLFSREELTALVVKYHQAGQQCVIHANGDAAADDILAAVEEALRQRPADDPRFLLVHAQTVRREQLERCRELKVTPTFFTLHEYYFGDRHREVFLGPERAAFQNPMRTARDLGLVISAHCDVPVVPVTPFLSMQACVTRRCSSGVVNGPEERISRVDALRAHTINAAWQNFEDQDRGSLEAGKFADLAVLDADPLTCDPENLHRIAVLRTVVGGETVFVR